VKALAQEDGVGASPLHEVFASDPLSGAESYWLANEARPRETFPYLDQQRIDERLMRMETGRSRRRRSGNASNAHRPLHCGGEMAAVFRATDEA